MDEEVKRLQEEIYTPAIKKKLTELGLDMCSDAYALKDSQDFPEPYIPVCFWVAANGPDKEVHTRYTTMYTTNLENETPESWSHWALIVMESFEKIIGPSRSL